MCPAVDYSTTQCLLYSWGECSAGHLLSTYRAWRGMYQCTFKYSAWGWSTSIIYTDCITIQQKDTQFKRGTNTYRWQFGQTDSIDNIDSTENKLSFSLSHPSGVFHANCHGVELPKQHLGSIPALVSSWKCKHTWFLCHEELPNSDTCMHEPPALSSILRTGRWFMQRLHLITLFLTLVSCSWTLLFYMTKPYIYYIVCGFWSFNPLQLDHNKIMWTRNHVLIVLNVYYKNSHGLMENKLKESHVVLLVGEGLTLWTIIKSRKLMYRETLTKALMKYVWVFGSAVSHGQQIITHHWPYKCKCATHIYSDTTAC